MEYLQVLADEALNTEELQSKWLCWIFSSSLVPYFLLPSYIITLLSLYLVISSRILSSPFISNLCVVFSTAESHSPFSSLATASCLLQPLLVSFNRFSSLTTASLLFVSSVELIALQERSDKLEDSMDMASKQSPEKLTELVSLQRGAVTLIAPSLLVKPLLFSYNLFSSRITSSLLVSPRLFSYNLFSSRITSSLLV